MLTLACVTTLLDSAHALYPTAQVAVDSWRGSRVIEVKYADGRTFDILPSSVIGATLLPPPAPPSGVLTPREANAPRSSASFRLNSRPESCAQDASGNRPTPMPGGHHKPKPAARLGPAPLSRTTTHTEVKKAPLPSWFSNAGRRAAAEGDMGHEGEGENVEGASASWRQQLSGWVGALTNRLRQLRQQAGDGFEAGPAGASLEPLGDDEGFGCFNFQMQFNMGARSLLSSHGRPNS